MTKRNASGRAPAMSTLRDCADGLCLWSLCRRAVCQKARRCRGDPKACVALMRAWLRAMAVAPAKAQAADAAEKLIMTPQELRAYRVWRSAVEDAEVKPTGRTTAVDKERMREDLARRVAALRRQRELDTAAR